MVTIQWLLYNDYYCLITNELNKSDQEIIDIHKILHEIGDIFDIPYRLKGLTLGKMKQIVAQSKK